MLGRLARVIRRRVALLVVTILSAVLPVTNKNMLLTFQKFSNWFDYCAMEINPDTNSAPCHMLDQKRIEALRMLLENQKTTQSMDGAKNLTIKFGLIYMVECTFKKFIRAVVPVFCGPRMTKSGKSLHFAARAGGKISKCRLSALGLVHVGVFASFGNCLKYRSASVTAGT